MHRLATRISQPARVCYRGVCMVFHQNIKYVSIRLLVYAVDQGDPRICSASGGPDISNLQPLPFLVLLPVTWGRRLAHVSSVGLLDAWGGRCIPGWGCVGYSTDALCSSPLGCLGETGNQATSPGITTANELQHPERQEPLHVLCWQSPFLIPQPPKCTGSTFVGLLAPFVGPVQMLLTAIWVWRKEPTETETGIQSVCMFIDGWSNRSVFLSLSLPLPKQEVHKQVKRLYKCSLQQHIH